MTASADAAHQSGVGTACDERTHQTWRPRIVQVASAVQLQIQLCSFRATRWGKRTSAISLDCNDNPHKIEYKTCSRTCQISTYGLSLGNSSCLRSHSPPIVSSQSTNLDAPIWDPTLQLVAFVTCLIPSSSHSTTTVAAYASFLRIKVLR